jgi:hypothetical protein
VWFRPVQRTRDQSRDLHLDKDPGRVSLPLLAQVQDLELQIYFPTQAQELRHKQWQPQAIGITVKAHCDSFPNERAKALEQESKDRAPKF